MSGIGQDEAHVVGVRHGVALNVAHKGGAVEGLAAKCLGCYCCVYVLALAGVEE